MDWILKHKVLSIIIAFAFAIAAWYFLSGSTPATVISSNQPSQSPQGTDQLVQSLLALQSVTLSGTIFSDPSFQVLKDFTTPITPEPVGRPDPFAPLGVTGNSTIGSTTTTLQGATH